MTGQARDEEEVSIALKMICSKLGRPYKSLFTNKKKHPRPYLCIM